MKVSVIIQARMASTRLPGKVMRKVLDKPLLGHMIHRIKYAKNVDDITIATSDDQSNDKMCEYLKELNINTFRGNEDDVLDRFYQAAEKHKFEYIVRLTADCPLIDPAHLDKMIQTFFETGADYIYQSQEFAEGMDAEVFTFTALEKAHAQAQLRSEREHVTQFFHNNPDSFKIVRLENDTDDSKYRITVDEKEDFLVVKRIIKELYSHESKPFGISEIKTFLDNHPEIFNINCHIIRNEGLIKSLQNDSELL